MKVRIALAFIIFSALTLFSVENVSPIMLDEWQRQSGGVNMLNDYFSKEPRVKALLRNVEANHFNRVPSSSSNPNFSIKNLVAVNIYIAARELKYVLDRFPNHPKALEIMGDISMMMNDPLFGAYYFERAILLYPQYAITHIQYGNFLMEIGKIDESINEFQIASDIAPNFPEPYLMLSKAHVKKGNIEIAKEFEKKAESLGYNVQITDNSAMGK